MFKMSPLVILTILWLSASVLACSKDKPKVDADTPLISSIPDKFCTPFIQPTGDFLFGSHEFSTGVFYAAPFYCGVREGKRCYYYLQLDAVLPELPLEDVRCE